MGAAAFEVLAAAPEPEAVPEADPDTGLVTLALGVVAGRLVTEIPVAETLVGRMVALPVAGAELAPLPEPLAPSMKEKHEIRISS